MPKVFAAAEQQLFFVFIFLVFFIARRRFRLLRMNPFKKLVLFFTLNLFAFHSVYSNDKVKLAADFWCPYNCRPKSKFPGFLIEIAQEAFKKASMEVEYKIMTWDTAVAAAREGKIDGIVGAYKEDAPDFIFTQLPLTKSVQKIFVELSDPWTYVDESSLKGRKIGVAHGYAYGEKADVLIRKKHPAFISFSGESPSDQMLLALKKKKINSIYEDRLVLKYALSLSNHKSDELKETPSIGGTENDVFIAFSPAHKERSQRLSQILDKYLAEASKTKVISQMLEKYLR